MKLEPHEVEKYQNIPIIDDFEQGQEVHLLSLMRNCSTFYRYYISSRRKWLDQAMQLPLSYQLQKQVRAGCISSAFTRRLSL